MSDNSTNQSLYYLPESKAPLSGIVICLGLAVVVGLIGGLIYAYASWYIPFIYIQFILTGGFGLIIGLTMARGFLWGKIRGGVYQKMLAFAAALIGFYCAWAIWEALVLEQSPFLLLLNPLAVWDTSRLFNVMGLWSIAGDTPITGTLLYLFWALEAIIIFGVALYIAKEDRPFSVAGNNWAEENILSARQSLVNPTLLKGELEAKNYKTLLSLEAGAANTHHTRLVIYDCEGSDDYFLLLQRIVFEENEGNMEAVPYDLVKFIRLEPETARNLLSAG